MIAYSFLDLIPTLSARKLPGRRDACRAPSVEYARDTPAMSTSVGRIDGHRFGSQPTSSETHLAGRILWLPWPKKRTIGLGQDGAVPRRLYNHPVVLLSPEPIRGKVMVLSVRAIPLAKEAADTNIIL